MHPGIYFLFLVHFCFYQNFMFFLSKLYSIKKNTTEWSNGPKCNLFACSNTSTNYGIILDRTTPWCYKEDGDCKIWSCSRNHYLPYSFCIHFQQLLYPGHEIETPSSLWLKTEFTSCSLHKFSCCNWELLSLVAWTPSLYQFASMTQQKAVSRSGWVVTSCCCSSKQ